MTSLESPQPGSKRSALRASNRETRDLLAAIVEAGGTVTACRSNNGHYKVHLEGRLIGTLAGTPSDRRSRKNDISHLRRNGLQITSKGTYVP